MEKRLIVFIVIIVFILNSYNVLACIQDKMTGVYTGDDCEQRIERDLASNKEVKYKGYTIKGNAKFDGDNVVCEGSCTINGQSFDSVGLYKSTGENTFTGNFVINNIKYAGQDIEIDANGKIVDCKSLATDKANIEKAKGVEKKGPSDLEIAEFYYYNDGTIKAVMGEGLKISGDYFSLEKGSTVDDTKNDRDAFSSEVINYESDMGYFSVDSAKAVVIDGYMFTDIDASDFTMDGGTLVSAHITSAIDNNTFDLKNAQVILDSGEQFEAEFYADGSLTIDTSDPALITTDEETVITLTETIDPGRNITGDANRSTIVQAVGRSTVEIDSVLGVVAIHLAPTSRYVSYANSSEIQPFSIYAPEGDGFDFYLKKHANQTTGFEAGVGGVCF